jgi:hypothetical protein
MTGLHGATYETEYRLTTELFVMNVTFISFSFIDYSSAPKDPDLDTMANVLQQQK